MEVRFFAGAAEAAGTQRLEMDAAPDASIGGVVARLGEGNARLTRVLAVSCLLLDGVRVSDPDRPVGAASRLDVLPPFAGG